MLMKLLVFVTESTLADPTVDALVEQGFRVTRLASTGGFLRKGNTTLLVGVEDNAVDRAVGLARRAAIRCMSSRAHARAGATSRRWPGRFLRCLPAFTCTISMFPKAPRC